MDPYRKFLTDVYGFGHLTRSAFDDTRIGGHDPAVAADMAVLPDSFPEFRGSGVFGAYNELPLPVRIQYGLKEFMWLSDDEKQRILEISCNPDPMEFGT